MTHIWGEFALCIVLAANILTTTVLLIEGRTAIISKSRSQQPRVKCAQCFASCRTFSACSHQCASPAEFCNSLFCDRTVDYHAVDGFYILRLGCADRPARQPTTDGSISGNRRDRYSSHATYVYRIDDLVEEFLRPVDTSDSAKKGLCYSAGAISTPFEYCTCGDRDFCNVETSSVEPEFVSKEPDHRCCVVSQEMLPHNWHNACPTHCQGTHCITDLIGTRKTCGMQMATFRPDILPRFETKDLPTGLQLCLMYETAGRHQLIDQCFCQGEFCNEKVEKPDYLQLSTGLKMPTFECLSCRAAGTMFTLSNLNYSCNQTCHGHYCQINLSTTQLVQYYDEENDEILLPEMENGHFELQSGCIRVNHPGLIQNGGCSSNWMHGSQPNSARCSCIGDRCNTWESLKTYIQTFRTTNATHDSDVSLPISPETQTMTSFSDDSPRTSTTPINLKTGNSQHSMYKPTVSSTTAQISDSSNEFFENLFQNLEVPEDAMFGYSPKSAPSSAPNPTPTMSDSARTAELSSSASDLMQSTSQSRDYNDNRPTATSSTSHDMRNQDSEPLSNDFRTFTPASDIRQSTTTDMFNFFHIQVKLRKIRPLKSTTTTSTLSTLDPTSSKPDRETSTQNADSGYSVRSYSIDPRDKFAFIEEVRQRKLFKTVKPSAPGSFPKKLRAKDGRVNYSPFFPVPDKKYLAEDSVSQNTAAPILSCSLSYISAYLIIHILIFALKK